MKQLFNKNYVIVLLLMAIPLVSFSQEDSDSFRNIEPPPTPIDDYVIHFAIAAIVLAAFYFYKTNLKTEMK
jgi:hypothetical protein